MQIIFLTGNLTKDAETKVSNKDGRTVEFVCFSMACNEQIGQQKATTYYDITSAKSGSYPYLKKGQPVSVIGNYRQTVSTAPGGKEFRHNNVSAFRVELAGKKGQEPNVPTDDW